MREIFKITSLLLCVVFLSTQLMSAQVNTVYNEATDSAVAEVTPLRRNLVQRVIHYFESSNEVHPEKKVDFTFLGGPSYSESTSLQLALMGAGLYKTHWDSITPMSNVTAFVQGSVKGMFRVGIKGNHFSPSDKFRINYHLDFAYFPLEFWGIGYAMESDDANRSSYLQLQSDVWAEFLWQVSENLYVGPTAEFNYTTARKCDSPMLWDGQPMRLFNYGPGIMVSFDNRDFPTNASKGWGVEFKQRFFPKFIGNKMSFSMSELKVNWYKKFWSSGIFAFQLHGAATYGSTPWSMMPTVDKSDGIRGYFEGRYRDKKEVDIIVELRQHIWRRNGIVVWAGVGSVFDRFSDIKGSTLLPSFGIGYRWEFKNRVNIRVDYGIGKHSTGLSIGINEVF